MNEYEKTKKKVNFVEIRSKQQTADKAEQNKTKQGRERKSMWWSNLVTHAHVNQRPVSLMMMMMVSSLRMASKYSKIYLHVNCEHC